MKLDKVIRVGIAAIIALVFVIAIAATLFVTESALNVWDRLVQGPKVILYGYVSVMLALAIAAVWLIWRLVVRRKAPDAAKAAAKPLSKNDIRDRLEEAEKAGVNVAEAQAELQELAARQAAGAILLCFFGEISTGKSSLIKALVPAADVAVDVIGGSTTDVQHYRWRDDDGHEILLTDVPGTGGHEAGLTEVAMFEAQRSHVVLFVCDGDLSRQEAEAVEQLSALGKPVIIVMNKSDRFDVAEQAALLQRLLEHLDRAGGQIERDRVVAVSAGGEREVVERASDGSEATVKKQRPADIGVLVVAINRLLEDPDDIDQRRDRAVFRLAADKLAAAEAHYRAQRSEQVIRNATRKAVVGSLAAVSPGTDVLIQGYIGTAMTQELCKLYDAAPRDLDVEEFLNLSQSLSLIHI